MYRKRARAAHVLQPAANTAAAPPPPQNNAPLGGDGGNDANSQPQHGAFNQAPNLAGQPQFFNPMTYQNGYNYEQPSYPGGGGDQPQEMPVQQDTSQAQSQQVAGADGLVQSGGGWNSAANYPQGTNDAAVPQPQQTEQPGRIEFLITSINIFFKLRKQIVSESLNVNNIE